MEFRIRRISREKRYQGSLLSFYQDEMELPDGKRTAWDFVSHPTGGACVVAVFPDGKILMEHQYRPAIDRETIELPAGAREDADEEPMATAMREMEEETGYTADRLVFLVHLDTAPSWCNECTDVYLAENIRRMPCGEINKESRQAGEAKENGFDENGRRTDGAEEAGLDERSRHLDEAEEIGLEAIEPEKLSRMIFSGQITDAKTVAGILAYFRYKEKRAEPIG